MVFLLDLALSPRTPRTGATMWVVSLLCSLPGGGFPASAAPLAGDATLTEARPSLLIDVSDAESPGTGTLPGFDRIRLRPEPSVLADSELFRALPPVAGLPEDCRLLIVDDPGDPGRIARTFAQLTDLGHQVGLLDPGAVVDGEIPSGAKGTGQGPCTELPPAWEAAVRMPRPPATRPGAPPQSAPDPVFVDRDWVVESYGEAGIELVDTRDADSWVDYEPPEPFAAGHIPHALPFPLAPLLAADGSWPKTEDELTAAHEAFRRFGPRPSTRVPASSTFVLYGHGVEDDTPHVAYLALRLLGFRARIFVGGWQRWAAEPEAPIVRLVKAEELHGWIREQEAAAENGDSTSPLLLFDSRTAPDWRLKHVPTSRNLPAYDFQDRFESVLDEIDPGLDRARTRLVFYCYGTDCVRSRKCATWAARAGFRQIYWFREGLDGWSQARLPFASDYPEARFGDLGNE